MRLHMRKLVVEYVAKARLVVIAVLRGTYGAISHLAALATARKGSSAMFLMSSIGLRRVYL